MLKGQNGSMSFFSFENATVSNTDRIDRPAFLKFGRLHNPSALYCHLTP